MMALVAPPGAAQVSTCGDDFELFIRNPDVGASNDGKFHVTGDFFMQFQVIGDRADEIETFAFSVGLPVHNPEQICTLPIWPGGTMLEAYKSDSDGDDGFFILMRTNTDSTPQNVDLSVAVHGYDAAGNELARFWSTAVIENCPDVGGGCDEATALPNDRTMPWPIILPGDGEKSLVDGFTVEFAEVLADLTILLNNEDITDRMVEWPGRTWDLDTVWDYGPRGLFGTVAPSCSLPNPIHNCGPPAGPAYEWTERSMQASDVIRVEATDLNGNVAVKEIHIGSSVAGGAIADGLPVLQMTFANTTLEAEPGTTAYFEMTMQNTGGGEGHPFASADVPPGWDYTWVPGHEPVPAGGSSRQTLEVKVPANATAGSYDATALIAYRQGSNDQTLQGPLTIQVVAPTEPVDGGIDPAADSEEESPGIPFGFLIGVLGAGAWVARRPGHSTTA